MPFHSAYCTVPKFLKKWLHGGKQLSDVGSISRKAQFQKNKFSLPEEAADSKERFKTPQNFFPLSKISGKLRKSEKISNSTFFQNRPFSRP